MRKFCLFIIVLFSVTSTLFSQKKVSWNDLAQVTFRNVYNVNYDDYFLKPTFDTSVEALEGTKIKLTGYFLDFSSEDDQFLLLSRNPMSSCFFCGGSGPESVVEVIFKNNTKYKTDQIVEIIGVLELNDDDVDHCNYILRDAIGRLIE
ncbi:hypothetical protein [uncultured Aquimarina sp.]|uniref:hypothetical protein n=1 Tax=uncultured Aquimarina sp. TaxID=575652 RepID=UPI00261701D7|nr:hypothetical protein [uncultured Aquimarina sp.]